MGMRGCRFGSAHGDLFIVLQSCSEGGKAKRSGVQALLQRGQRCGVVMFMADAIDLVEYWGVTYTHGGDDKGHAAGPRRREEDGTAGERTAEVKENGTSSATGHGCLKHCIGQQECVPWSSRRPEGL